MQNKGFTLVEVMVSLALFGSVVTMAVGTLLVLIDANTKAQNVQLAVTNVSFALDSMSREIRTGLYFYCDGDGEGMPSAGTSVSNCGGSINSVGLVVTEGGTSLTGLGGDHRIAYRQKNGAVERRITNGSWQKLTAPEVTVDTLNFVVTDASVSDNKSPTVTIYIAGTAGDVVGIDTYFKLQTTVTQQVLDI